MNLKRLYYRLTTKTPTRELGWNSKDFRTGMRWAKSLPHPFSRSMSLWDSFRRLESEEILSFLNKKIRENQINGIS